MQDFTFLREQVVVDAQATDGFQLADDDGVGDDFADARRVAVALFDFFECLAAEAEARFVFREVICDARV